MIIDKIALINCIKLQFVPLFCQDIRGMRNIRQGVVCTHVLFGYARHGKQTLGRSFYACLVKICGTWEINVRSQCARMSCKDMRDMGYRRQAVVCTCLVRICKTWEIYFSLGFARVSCQGMRNTGNVWHSSQYYSYIIQSRILPHVYRHYTSR